MFHELPSRDREDELATGQPQGVGSEAYLNNSTSQGPTPEDARKGGHIRGLSRPFVKYPGCRATSSSPCLLGQQVNLERPTDRKEKIEFVFRLKADFQ